MTDYKAPTTFKVGSTQTVAVGSSSAATSNAFDSQTREIRIVTTVDAYVEMNATSPTATSSSLACYKSSCVKSGINRRNCKGI
jgi:hypothetical protein